MTHAPALRGCFPCWRADARLPSDRLRPPRRQRVAERALLGLVLEQGDGHKMILPSLAILSRRIAIVEGAEPWQAAHHHQSSAR